MNKYIPLRRCGMLLGAARVAVFKGDRWYDPAQLYEAVGIKPFTRLSRAGGKT
jgi:hypothetical protein